MYVTGCQGSCRATAPSVEESLSAVDNYQDRPVSTNLQVGERDARREVAIAARWATGQLLLATGSRLHRTTAPRGTDGPGGWGRPLIGQKLLRHCWGTVKLPFHV